MGWLLEYQPGVKREHQPDGDPRSQLPFAVVAPHGMTKEGRTFNQEG